MKGFLLPYLLSFLLLLTLCESSDDDSSTRKIVDESSVGFIELRENKGLFIRFSSSSGARLNNNNNNNNNRLLSGEYGDDKEDEDEDEEDWWDNRWDNDDEDENQDNKNNNNNNGGGGGEGFRPGNDDNHYDCESMMNYLDYLPPECQHWGHNNNRPDDVAGAPTMEPTAEDANPDDNNGNNDTTTFQDEDILIRMSFRVGLRTRLRPRQVFRLRTAVANSVSRVLNRKSPFHVPKPIWNDAILGFLSSISPMGTNNPSSSSSSRPQDRPNAQSRPQDRPNAGPGREVTNGWRANNREPPMDPTLIDPSSIDPEAFSDEIPDATSISSSSSSEMQSRGSRQQKGNLWLHHYNTDLFDEVVRNTTTQRWYYPVEVKYLVFWNVLEHLVEDPQVLANISRICWHIGNETLANGDLKGAIVEEIENDNGIFDAIDGMFGDDDEEDKDEDWTGIMDDDLLDLDGLGDGGVPTQTDQSGEILFPTFPIVLSASTWSRREYFGLYLMISTLIVATVMRYGATRNDKDDSAAQLAPNGEQHLLTEEGVDEFLNVGWKYQKQKTDGETSSQLYLHVYDKSGIGYSKDNSMLMGGNEQIVMNNDDDKPNSAISPSHTASTEQETNSATHRESLTHVSSERRTSSRNSGQSSRTPTSSFAHAPSSSIHSHESERKRHDGRRRRRKSGEKSQRKARSERKSSRRNSGESSRTPTSSFASNQSRESERKRHDGRRRKSREKSSRRKTRSDASDEASFVQSSSSPRFDTTNAAAQNNMDGVVSDREEHS